MDEIGGFEIIDERFRDYLLPESRLEKNFDGMAWGEGPVWFADGDYLLVSDIPNNRILRWSDGEGMSVFREPSNFANGNTLDREGRLITCEHGRRAVSRTNRDGTVEILAERYRGGRLNSPNDVVVKSDGTIWFTDPEYGIQDDVMSFAASNEQDGRCYVFRLDPESHDLEVVIDDFAMPNGLAFSADERRLYVVDSGADKGLDLHAIPDELPDPHHIVVFDVIDGDGSKTNGCLPGSRPACPTASALIQTAMSGRSPSTASSASHPTANCWARSGLPKSSPTSRLAGPGATGCSWRARPRSIRSRSIARASSGRKS